MSQQQQADPDASIFGPFHDGEAPAYADPMQLWRDLMRATAGRLRALWRAAGQRGPDDADGDDEATLARKGAERASADAQAFPAIEALLAAARVAFKMIPFDRSTGRGATERHCWDALNSYFRFLSAEGNGRGPTRT